MDCKTIYARNELIWGEDAQKVLFQKHVAVFGLGGVGSYTAEALARSGVGKITVVDFDEVSETNINRQLIALNSSIGMKKTYLIEKRINEINQNIAVNAINDFFTVDLVDKIFCEQIDYVVDAIDTIKSKIELLENSYKRNIPVITSLGAGNRLYPEKLYLADISEVDSQNCNFIKSIKYRLQKLGINRGITAVASSEKPLKIEKNLSIVKKKTETGQEVEFRKIIPGSSPFVPPVAGYIMAGHVIRSFISCD